MTNPLGEGSARHTRHWAVGETRMVGGDTKIPVTRTDREFVYDLRDAYNAARTSNETEWFVHNGQLRLGVPDSASLEITRRIERDKEAERARWKRNYFAQQRSDRQAA